VKKCRSKFASQDFASNKWRYLCNLFNDAYENDVMHIFTSKQMLCKISRKLGRRCRRSCRKFFRESNKGQ